MELQERFTHIQATNSSQSEDLWVCGQFANTMNWFLQCKCKNMVYAEKALLGCVCDRCQSTFVRPIKRGYIKYFLTLPYVCMKSWIYICLKANKQVHEKLVR